MSLKTATRVIGLAAGAGESNSWSKMVANLRIAGTVIFTLGLFGLLAPSPSAAMGTTRKPPIISGEVVSVAIRYLPGRLAAPYYGRRCGWQCRGEIALINLLPAAHYGRWEAARLASRLNNLKWVESRDVFCPLDDFSQYRLRFVHHSGQVTTISVETSGCRWLWNPRAPPATRWSTGALLDRLHTLLVRGHGV